MVILYNAIKVNYISWSQIFNTFLIIANNPTTLADPLDNTNALDISNITDDNSENQYRLIISPNSFKSETQWNNFCNNEDQLLTYTSQLCNMLCTNYSANAIIGAANSSIASMAKLKNLTHLINVQQSIPHELRKAFDSKYNNKNSATNEFKNNFPHPLLERNNLLDINEGSAKLKTKFWSKKIVSTDEMKELIIGDGTMTKNLTINLLNQYRLPHNLTLKGLFEELGDRSEKFRSYKFLGQIKDILKLNIRSSFDVYLNETKSISNKLYIIHPEIEKYYDSHSHQDDVSEYFEEFNAYFIIWSARINDLFQNCFLDVYKFSDNVPTTLFNIYNSIEERFDAEKICIQKYSGKKKFKSAILNTIASQLKHNNTNGDEGINKFINSYIQNKEAAIDYIRNYHNIVSIETLNTIINFMYSTYKKIQNEFITTIFDEGKIKLIKDKFTIPLVEFLKDNKLYNIDNITSINHSIIYFFIKFILNDICNSESSGKQIKNDINRSKVANVRFTPICLSDLLSIGDVLLRWCTPASLFAFKLAWNDITPYGKVEKVYPKFKNSTKLRKPINTRDKIHYQYNETLSHMSFLIFNDNTHTNDIIGYLPGMEDFYLQYDNKMYNAHIGLVSFISMNKTAKNVFDVFSSYRITNQGISSIISNFLKEYKSPYNLLQYDKYKVRVINSIGNNLYRHNTDYYKIGMFPLIMFMIAGYQFHFSTDDFNYSVI